MQQVSDYELELMKIIWAAGGTALYAQIVDGLEARGSSWTKNTVITLLSRLVDKGMLGTSKIGRRNKYVALVGEADYKQEQTVRFVDKLFEGNPRGLVTALIQKDLLTEEDYEELKQFWKGGRGKDE